MVRLSDIPQPVGAFLGNMPMTEFESSPWVRPPALTDARIALISTAGLHRRSDRKFLGLSNEYRIIPGDVDLADVAMSHASVNFDRSGFQRDVNLVLPLERLRELANAGEIGSVAQWHYSFMGATPAEQFKETAVQVAKLLKDDGVTAAMLVPV